MGEKHYFIKRLACRNDYCTHCRKSTMTERYRYLVVLTKLTLPILPIGIERSWACSECGRNPRGAAPEGVLGLILGITLGAGLSYFAFVLPFPDDQAGVQWGLRIMFVGFTLFLVYRLVTQNRKNYREKVAGVVPLDKTHCPYCSDPLLPGMRARCYACKVDVL